MNKLIKKEGRNKERRHLRLFNDGLSHIGTPNKHIKPSMMSTPSKQQRQERHIHLRQKQELMREVKEVNKNFDADVFGSKMKGMVIRTIECLAQ